MTATDSYLLLRAFVDELVRCGMRHACTSPGSRCTPIVLTLAREQRLNCWSHIDERCAGFFALGAAKASGRPVAVTCTSGTAAANLAGAVIEAHAARVPLLVLTADRPPELREIGAGQTIDQIKLYGSAVKWFFEVGTQEATAERLRWIRALACRAYCTALKGRPGPVHLNFPLREPLVLGEALGEDPVPGRPDGKPWVLARPVAPEALPAQLELPPRTVLVAGACGARRDGARSIAGLAERLSIPLLADPLSGARSGPAAIAHYDLLLRDPGLARSLRPELVLRVGDLPTSKPLRAWLASLVDVPQYVLDPERAWQDPASVVTHSIAAPAEALARASMAGESDPRWLASWRAADALAHDAIEQLIGEELTEPAVAAHLAAWLPADATLFVASSMPVRDLESFQPALERPPRILSNRGANGIDGTVSSAFGVAAAGDGPAVLLIGDVALAHDIGGLMAARRSTVALTVVVVNNDGGGIFHFLPVAGEQDAFEGHVATPHGLDFTHAAQLYGAGYERAATLGDLRAALERSLGSACTTLIEVRSDRAANFALHRALERAALASLSR